jgi:hypothetical protein
LHVAVLPIPLLTLSLGLDVPVVDFMLAVSSAAVVFPCSKAAFSWPARAALRGGAFSEAGRKLVTPL